MKGFLLVPHANTAVILLFATAVHIVVILFATGVGVEVV